MFYKVYERRGAFVKIPRPESLKDCITLIKSDCVRYGVSLRGALPLLLRNQGFAYIFYMRLCMVRSFIYPFARYMKYRIGKRYGLQMSHKVPLGYGFFLLHPFGLIVNETSVIGNNVSISQYVTIGAMTKTGALIGDEVYIGPSSCIVEDVVIGRKSVVGAGTVVVKDVKESSTVAGVPAKVVSLNDSKNYIWNKSDFV